VSAAGKPGDGKPGAREDVREPAQTLRVGQRLRFRVPRQAAARRVQLRIAQRFPQMHPIQWAGVITTLPGMAARLMNRIPINRIAAMGMPQAQSQAVSIVRSDDQVDVIRHRTQIAKCQFRVVKLDEVGRGPARGRLSGAGLKPARAAAVESCGGERRVKSPGRDLGR
jgi:hypothetical protein